jgi:hypothetical protein
MAPAKFLQTHDVESLRKHIQNQAERRNKKELERRKFDQGQETPSQPPMVTPGPQAILKTETAVPTKARTIDVFCSPKDPSSATDIGVGNAARKDPRLTCPEACNGKFEDPHLGPPHIWAPQKPATEFPATRLLFEFTLANLLQSV